MDNARKKELARSYKETKRPQGIFAVRCNETAEVWVSASRNLGGEQKKTWFMLRTGGHPNKVMQGAWNTHGEPSFRYEVLEEVDDDNPLLIASLLKEREQHWRTQLSAGRVVG